MTAIDHPRPRSTSPVLPIVASVGSPWDEWSTVALPAVVGAALLDPDTVALPAVAPVSGAPVSGAAVSGAASPHAPLMGRRPRRTVQALGVVPSPWSRAARVPAPRAGGPIPVARSGRPTVPGA